jgi:hypothetical protein
MNTEYSYDTSFKGRPNGAFTYYALKTLRESKPVSCEAWFAKIRAFLPSTRLPQSPQIFGTETARRFKVLEYRCHGASHERACSRTLQFQLMVKNGNPGGGAAPSLAAQVPSRNR